MEALFSFLRLRTCTQMSIEGMESTSRGSCGSRAGSPPPPGFLAVSTGPAAAQTSNGDSVNDSDSGSSGSRRNVCNVKRSGVALLKCGILYISETIVRFQPSIISSARVRKQDETPTFIHLYLNFVLS